MTEDRYLQAPPHGGIFRFIPFEGTRWVKQLLISGLQVGQIKVMLLVLLSNFLITTFILVSCAVQTYRQRFVKPVTSLDALPAKTRVTKDSNKRNFETAFMELQECSLSFGNQNSLKVSNRLSPNHCLLSNVNKKLKPTLKVNSYNKKSPVITPVPQHQKEIRSFPVEVSHSNFQISNIPLPMAKKKKYAHSLILLISLMSLSIISLLLHLLSTVFLLYTLYTLLTTLRQLPTQFNQIVIQAANFSSFVLDTTYNTSIQHITKDSSRINGGGYLHQIVTRTERMVANTMTCLTLDCTKLDDSVAMNLTETNRFWHIIPFSNGLSSEAKQLADSLLKDYHLTVRRLTKLYPASNILTGGFIHRVQRAWYEYRQLLSSLVFVQPHMAKGEHEMLRLINPGLDKLVTLLCKNVQNETTKPAALCHSITEFMGHVEKLPFLLPSNSLEDVVQYSLLPRALGVEQLVEDWLPVVSDLSGKGALFLLQTYLLPEIEKLKLLVHKIATELPRQKHINQYHDFLTAFQTAMVTVTLSVSICEIFLVVLLIRYITRGVEEVKHIESTSHVKTRKTKQTRISTLTRTTKNICHKLPLILTVLTMLLTVLAVTGILVNMVGLLCQTEICDCLFSGVTQDKADFVLTSRLVQYLRRVTCLNEFTGIPHLHLSIPYPILHTVSSEYRSGGTALLQSLHMVPPVNLSAILNSVWLNRTIMKTWNHNVQNVLQGVNVKEWLPKISFIEMFQQAVNTFKLHQKFDDLQVLHLNDYLNDPGRKNYGAILGNILKELSYPEFDQITSILHNLTVAYKSYLAKYDLTKVMLDRIRSNNRVLEPLLGLIGHISLVLDRLNASSKEELIFAVSRIAVEGWPWLVETVSEPAINFANGLLHDIVPYPGLHQLYLRTAGILCSLPGGNTSAQVVSPIVPQLSVLGVEFFAGVSSLLLPCSALLFVTLRDQDLVKR